MGTSYIDRIFHMSNEDLLTEYKQLLFNYYPLVNIEDEKKIVKVKEVILFRMRYKSVIEDPSIEIDPPDWHNDGEE